MGMSQGTEEALNLDCTTLRSGYWYTFGGFMVTPFRTEHDCAEPLGFLIEHPDFNKLLFVTDSIFVKSNFKNLKINHIMIEANYSYEIVNQRYTKGTLEHARVDRLLKTHMELTTTKKFIIANKTAHLDNIILIHLSDSNSDEQIFRETIQGVVGNDVKVYIADNGLEVKLDLFPW